MYNPSIFWDKLSDFYEKQNREMTPVMKKTVENTAKYLKNEDRVLEVGCGNATMTCELAGKVKEIIATDISAGMLEIAKKKKEEKNIKNIRFIQTDTFSQRFKPESFDIVICFNVLLYITNREGFLKRIHELLKPGGLFISVTPCIGENKSPLKQSLRNITLLLYLFVRLRIFASKTLSKMSSLKISDLKREMVSSGFTLTEIENLGGWEYQYFISAGK